MNRAMALVFLPALVVANVAAGVYWKGRLEARVAAEEEALRTSPQAQLEARRNELQALQRVVANGRRRPGFRLPEAMELFEQAAAGWEELALDSSTEAETGARLDVLTVRGLAGSEEQLTRVDRRLGPRCLHYRRSPTRDGRFILSCQVKPRG